MYVCLCFCVSLCVSVCLCVCTHVHTWGCSRSREVPCTECGKMLKGSSMTSCKESGPDPELQYACASKPNGKPGSVCAPVCKHAHLGAFIER